MPDAVPVSASPLRNDSRASAIISPLRLDASTFNPFLGHDGYQSDDGFGSLYANDSPTNPFSYTQADDPAPARSLTADLFTHADDFYLSTSTTTTTTSTTTAIEQDAADELNPSSSSSASTSYALFDEHWASAARSFYPTSGDPAAGIDSMEVDDEAWAAFMSFDAPTQPVPVQAEPTGSLRSLEEHAVAACEVDQILESAHDQAEAILPPLVGEDSLRDRQQEEPITPLHDANTPITPLHDANTPVTSMDEAQQSTLKMYDQPELDRLNLEQEPVALSHDTDELATPLCTTTKDESATPLYEEEYPVLPMLEHEERVASSLEEEEPSTPLHDHEEIKPIALDDKQIVRLDLVHAERVAVEPVREASLPSEGFWGKKFVSPTAAFAAWMGL